jgi:hypothetical protein
VARTEYQVWRRIQIAEPPDFEATLGDPDGIEDAEVADVST